ncbi:MAG: MFS transporter [Paracoccaceae bacterium]|jgi:UMF1 family MFS transporter
MEGPDDTPSRPAGAARSGRSRVFDRGVISWCIYDWANSAFGTLITTFVFAPYFTTAVAASPTEGTVLWGHASSIAAFLMAVASPVLGAVADKIGRRKPWLVGFTGLCVAFTAALYLVRPTADDVPLALVLFVCAAVSAELAFVFYNAMLPALVPRSFFGRVSGWGLALGFAGAIASLGVALMGFVRADAPLAGLDRGAAENIRATVVMVAAWYAVFALPLVLFTKDGAYSGIPLRRAVHEGMATLLSTLRSIGKYANIVRFLAAYLFYSNGIITLFAFGGIFAAGVFGMTMEQVILFAIALNVAAAVGAAGFGWVDDRIGSKATITITLLGLLVLGGILVATTSTLVVWTAGPGLGLFVGGGQATSRAMMARLSPKGMEGEMFGLYALSGRATAFAGPLAVALATDAFDDQRAGMAAVLAFFVVGLLLMSRVRSPERTVETP